MLRIALLVLLIANAGYLAWSQGWMEAVGLPPAKKQTEAYRMQQQVRPEAIYVVVATESKHTASGSTLKDIAPVAVALVAADGAMTNPMSGPVVLAQVCLQTENMSEAEATKLQLALQQSELPVNAWELRRAQVGSARWMVYVGKFPSEDALEQRKNALKIRNIEVDRATGEWEIGLSLGRFSSEEGAKKAMTNFLHQGVQGVQVVQERAPQTLYALRFDAVSPALQQALNGLQATFEGKALSPCPS